MNALMRLVESECHSSSGVQVHAVSRSYSLLKLTLLLGARQRDATARVPELDDAVSVRGADVVFHGRTAAWTFDILPKSAPRLPKH